MRKKYKADKILCQFYFIKQCLTSCSMLNLMFTVINFLCPVPLTVEKKLYIFENSEQCPTPSLLSDECFV